jgi:hypothetical protein
MTRGRDYTGPSWQQPSWYLRRIDRHHRLGHRETVEAAIEACRRTRDAAATHPAADPYELARQAIAHVRHEHEIDDREPIPEPTPVDLDTLLTADGPKDASCAARPHATDPNRGA